jgi:predicted kinase
MKKEDLINLIEQEVQTAINEFQEDIGKLCIVLMGLPAAGKSTFINNDIHKYIPGFTGYKVTNSDAQVLALQYQTAKNHFEALQKSVGREQNKSKMDKKIAQFKTKSHYVDNRGKNRVVPITSEWWIDNKSKGIKAYWKAFYKAYYAVYFDIRDLAKAIDKTLFKTKIKQSGNILVIDTVAAKPEKIKNRLEQTKESGFTNIIVYLQVEPELSIIRDKYREKEEGRGVGESVIMNYAGLMDGAYQQYKKEGMKPNGVVDRLMKFTWKPSGASPIKGTWVKEEDNRFSLKRKIKQMKSKD